MATPNVSRSAPMERHRVTFAICLALALALHLFLLLGWKNPFLTPAQDAVQNGDNSVEVTVMDTPAEPAATPEPVVPAATPLPASPEPTPVPTPPPVAPEMVLPSSSPLPPPPPVPKTKSAHTGAALSKAAPRTVPGQAGRGASTQAKPSYLRNPAPEYPAVSKQNREQGVVMLTVSVDQEGRVSGLRVSRSSGYPRLDSAAEEAVRAWRFNPARAGGMAVSSEIEVPVRFRLDR